MEPIPMFVVGVFAATLAYRLLKDLITRPGSRRR